MSDHLTHESRAHVAVFLPNALAKALSSYHGFMDGTIPTDSKGFAAYHSAAKVAIAHIEKIAELEASERKVALEQINQSLREEVGSDDVYVRRMRPTFGYLIAITWAAQMLALAYVIIFETEKASIVIEAMESLGTIWAVGLSVLGVYVYKRSEDKKLISRNYNDRLDYEVLDKSDLTSGVDDTIWQLND